MLATSAEAEALAGRRAAPALEQRFGGTLPDPCALERMQRIGRRLTECPGGAPGDWRFQLLASDKVNAFSLPGGLVYVTCGLYERIGGNDGLLAAVVAHEMAHVARKDSLKPSARTGRRALEREICADAKGTSYLAAAGYPRQCMTDLLRLIQDEQPPGWAEIRVNSLALPVTRSDNLAHTRTSR